MKPEMRKWIQEYVAVLPPGGTLVMVFNEIKEVKVPKKVWAKAMGLTLFMEILRVGIATFPLWMPYITGKEFETGDNATNEKLFMYMMTVTGYLMLSSQQRWFVNRTREYGEQQVRQQARINSLYPLKIHPTYTQEQGEPGDLEKRL